MADLTFIPQSWGAKREKGPGHDDSTRGEVPAWAWARSHIISRQQVKQLGVDTDEGKAVASARETLSKAAEDSPAGISPSQGPIIQSREGGGGNVTWPTAQLLGPFALFTTALGLALLSQLPAL